MGGRVAVAIRIGQPCDAYDRDGYPGANPQFGQRPNKLFAKYEKSALG